jgi:hypothetical protein
MLIIVSTLLLSSIIITPPITAWKNGPTGSEFSSNPQAPRYGTHDWIAEHALDWLEPEKKRYILDNLATYLYGTELPDKTIGPDAIGDTALHVFYFDETETVMNDSAAQRAKSEQDLAFEYLENGDVYNGTLHLGIMTHYLVDLAAFGNVMNATYWGIATHHEEYMDYVNSEMTSYNSDFDSYLRHIPTTGVSDSSEGAKAIAEDTTFGEGENNLWNCTWMEANYSWSNPEFKDRAGESLNLATNIITAILKAQYMESLTAPSKPVGLVIDEVTGYTINLSWAPNTDKNLAGYSIFINKTDSATEFDPEPIANLTGTEYSVLDLNNETTYYFKIRAYSVVGKLSPYSDVVHAATLDITPPKVPSILNLPSMTNKPTLLVNGFTEENAKVEVYLDNDYSNPAGSAMASSGLGHYRTDINLTLGENNVTARAFDSSNNPSDFAPYQIVVMDSIPPVADGGANIEVNKRDSPVAVQFDGANSTDNQGAIGNYTWTIDLRTRLVKLYGVAPIFQFDKAGDFIVTLNVTDQINNWAIDQLWVNVTQLDYTSPYIISRSPEVNAINQSINVTIKAIFNEPLNASSIQIRLISKQFGELQVPRPSYDLSKQLLTLKPFANLTHQDSYIVIITATDLAGNPLEGGRWNFTTEPRPEDFDGDQIPDVWEWSHGLDANESDSRLDPDGDGLLNIDEYNKGNNPSDPNDPDTDNDGMSDYFERLYSMNPLNANDSSEDADNDGYTNLEEYEQGYDPLDPNSPERKGGPDGADDDYTWVIIALVIIIITILFLVLILRKLKYKQTGEVVKDDDGYLKTVDADELGIGGNIILESPQDYAFEGKSLKPEYRGPKGQDESEAAFSARGPISERPTPTEILKRAKEKEKKCTKCGAGLPQDTTYCFECGEVLEEK